MKRHVLLLMLLITLSTFSQSGEIDLSFGVNGKITTGFGKNNNAARCVAFQPDGKFIVGGYYVSSNGDNDFALARYNNDGTLDFTFGVGGKTVTNFLEINNNGNTILSLHVLPNGKILALGLTTQTFSPNMAVVRYNENGSIDTDFGSNGKIVSSLVGIDVLGYGGALAVQPDGKIIIAAVKMINFDPNYYIGLERYLEDGSLDTSFGTAGQAVASYGNGKSFATAVALQPDGKIVVGGTYMPTNVSVMAVMRFTTNGILDTAFDGDGKTTTSFGAGTTGSGMTMSVNANNKIVLAGSVGSNTSSNLGVLQYNANGSLDIAFDGDGKALRPFDLEDNYVTVNSFTRQPDGKFLAVFRAYYALTNTDFVVRRYNSDTSVDTAFGTNGKITATFDTGLNEAQSAFVAPDGKIVVVGKSIPLLYDHVDFGVARYSSNGILDATLDGDGKLTTLFEKGNDRMKTLLVLPNDKLIAIGISDYRNANNSIGRDIILSKYNSDGSLDTSFGNSGKVLSILGQQLNTISTAALQPDEKIVVGNMYYNPTEATYSYEIIRYNANGSLDTTFGTNGKRPIIYYAESIIFQPDGKIIIAGSGTLDTVNYGYIISRFNSNGTPDTSFDGDGSKLFSFGEFIYTGITIMLQHDNKIVLSCTTSATDVDGGAAKFALARFNSDGGLDTAFGNNGTVTTLIGYSALTDTGFLKPDGKIIVAGKSFPGDGSINFSSVQYNSNGTIDTAYGTDGVSSSGLWFNYKEINSILLQADDKLLVVLSQQNGIQNTYDFNLRRFNPDGTYDTGFSGLYGVSTSFYNGYDEAFAALLQSDDKIVVGGTTHNGINYDFALTRYDNVILGLPEDTVDSSTLVIYPNPVADILHIQSANALTEIIGCSVYTLLGQLVYNSSDNKQEIDTANLSCGIYTIVIRTNKGIVNKKFVKG